MPDSEPIHRCFMDGIDWQHHLEADTNGTLLFPSVGELKTGRTCIDKGGCGVVEVEVRLIRWVEPQDLNWVKADARMRAAESVSAPVETDDA